MATYNKKTNKNILRLFDQKNINVSLNGSSKRLTIKTDNVKLNSKNGKKYITFEVIKGLNNMVYQLPETTGQKLNVPRNINTPENASQPLLNVRRVERNYQQQEGVKYLNEKSTKANTKGSNKLTDPLENYQYNTSNPFNSLKNNTSSKSRLSTLPINNLRYNNSVKESMSLINKYKNKLINKTTPKGTSVVWYSPSNERTKIGKLGNATTGSNGKKKHTILGQSKNVKNGLKISGVQSSIGNNKLYVSKESYNNV